MTGDLPLVFDWPDGLALAAAEERAIETSDTAGDRRYRSRNRFTLTRRGDVIRITDHHREVLEHAAPPPGTFDHQRILRFVEESAPSFVLDDEGQVGAVLAEAAAAVRAAVAPPPAAAPPIAALVARFTSDGMLLTVAQSLWNPIVGGFAGLVLPRAGAARATLDIAVPALGGLPLPHAIETTLLEVHPDGRARVRCDVFPEPGTLARMAESFAAGLGRARVGAVEFATRTELVTDPASLVPEQVVVTRTSWMEVSAPGAEPRRIGQRDERRWTFDLAGPPDA